MKIDIITIFPNFFDSFLSTSIVARAIKEEKISVAVHDLRKWTSDNHRTVDDSPFGGGAGMVMMVEPIYKALKELGVYPTRDSRTKIVLTSASGKKWNQGLASSYSISLDRLVIICGHYEGIDYRVQEHLVDDVISIGDYVLTGGELPASIMIDSITRLLPGVLGNPDSLLEESHNVENETEYPQYTRPAEFETDEGDAWNTPDVLISGDHKKITEWREENRIKLMKETE